MAKTAFATDNALVKKAWDEKLFRDTVKNAYFSKFMSSGSDTIISEKTELTKQAGDTITFGIRMRLTGSGVTSGMTLEGKEEKLTTYSNTISLEQYRHAVRDNGALDRQRTMFSIDQESKDALQDWGSEKIDQLIFDAMLTSPTAIFYKTDDDVNTIAKTATAATAKAAMNATEGKISLNMLSFLKTWAKTGGGRSGALTPLRPVKVNGRAYYVLLVHPDCMYDLKVSSTFQQAMREAEVRGPENPLFQGATAIWDGVVIHEHENIPVYTDGGGSTVPWAHCLFLGAQAGLFAWGKRPSVIQKNFDFEDQHAYAWGMIGKAKKATFNSKDYGSFSVYLARTNVSGT